MRYFCYFTRAGEFKAIANPSSDIDERLPDIAFDFGFIEAKNMEECEYKCKQTMFERLNKLAHGLGNKNIKRDK